MINKNFIIGILLLVIGFVVFTHEYLFFIENTNNVYKLFGIPITYIGIKKLKGEKIF